MLTELFGNQSIWLNTCSSCVVIPVKIHYPIGVRGVKYYYLLVLHPNNCDFDRSSVRTYDLQLHPWEQLLTRANRTTPSTP